MSLEKAIKYGKEKRKPYYTSAAFDSSCRPHGRCEWCKGNRLKYKKIADEWMKYELSRIDEDWDMFYHT